MEKAISHLMELVGSCDDTEISDLLEKETSVVRGECDTDEEDVDEVEALGSDDSTSDDVSPDEHENPITFMEKIHRDVDAILGRSKGRLLSAHYTPEVLGKMKKLVKDFLQWSSRMVKGKPFNSPNLTAS